MKGGTKNEIKYEKVRKTKYALNEQEKIKKCELINSHFFRFSHFFALISFFVPF
jgi:hypothetical protein